MVRLLLARGADANGSCTCAGGESPLWVAVVQRETEIVDELLSAGADPNAVVFAGATALEVAQKRGYEDIATRLLDAGATPSRFEAAPVDDVPVHATGIKAIDLWCPLPARGLVHLTPGFGLGAIVLVGELSRRARRAAARASYGPDSCKHRPISATCTMAWPSPISPTS